MPNITHFKENFIIQVTYKVGEGIQPTKLTTFVLIYFSQFAGEN